MLQRACLALSGLTAWAWGREEPPESFGTSHLRACGSLHISSLGPWGAEAIAAPCSCVDCHCQQAGFPLSHLPLPHVQPSPALMQPKLPLTWAELVLSSLCCLDFHQDLVGAKAAQGREQWLYLVL